jgi:hypothetical protein
MPPSHHKPHWPDKAMFSSIMLILAGGMGLLFESLRSVASIGHQVPDWLKAVPVWYTIPLSIATLVLGFVSLRTQRQRYSYIGCAAGVLSCGFFGLMTILSLIAVFLLFKAHREEENLRGGVHRMHSSEWPDKALAASLFILVAGVMTFLQGSMILIGSFDPVPFNVPWVSGPFDILAGLVSAYAAREIYHLRRPTIGYVAAGLSIVGLGFYAIGPLLGGTAAILIWLAGREHEFVAPGSHAGTPATKTQAKRARKPA